MKIFLALSFGLIFFIAILFFTAGLYQNDVIIMDKNWNANMSLQKPMLTGKGKAIRICSQAERKAHIKEWCTKLNITVDDNQRTWMFVDSENKIAYCFIEKAGSTTIKSIMADIGSGGLFNKNKRVLPQMDRVHNMSQESYTAAEIKKDLHGYTKFIVVRNPMTRLVSAYYNRAAAYKNYFAALTKYTSKIKKDNNVSLTPFEGYLTMIQNDVKLKGGSLDKHWDNFFERSNPCNIDYDYILKLETMPIDMPKFIKEAYKGKVDSQEYQDFRRNVQYTSDSGMAINETFIKEYKNISEKLISSIVDKFKLEALFYGYGFAKGSSVAKCGYANNNNNDVCC